MGASKVTGLLFLALLACSNAFSGLLLPTGKELIYDYEAIVKAGTLTPVSFASQFLLTGHLHIQLNGNVSLVQLKDLKYQMYNGHLDHKHEHLAKDVPMPPEIADVTKVFSIVYDGEGKALGIVVDKTEKLYSINIKKSIASILQLEYTKIVSDKLPHAFVSKEQSIYGLGTVQYNVLPQHEEIHVQKMFVMPSTLNLMSHSITPVQTSMCEAEYQEPFSRDSQRKYWIVKQEGHEIVKHVEANGGIYYHPFEGQSEAQYIFVNQTLNLEKIIPASKLAAPSDILTINDLSYTLFDESVEFESVPHIDLGRRVHDGKKMIPLIMEDLEHVWTYLHKTHLHLQTPDIKEGQLINQLKRWLMYLDISGLDELYTQVLTKPVHIKNIFYELLPLVGTKASSLLILKLVETSKVDSSIAVSLLQSFPKHVMAPTQGLVVSLEGLIKLDEKLPWEIRKTAILAFSNLISVSYKFQGKIHKHKHFNEYVTENNIDSNIVYEVNPDKNLITFYDKYVLLYVNKMKSVKDTEQQMVYIQGLSNMHLEIVLPHLIPVIKGELWNDHHHRLMGIWAIAPIADLLPEKIYELLWPILANHDEHLELRIASYWIIMESLPNMPTFMNMYWFLKGEPDIELYHFHWSYLKSLSKRTDPCYSQMKMKATELLKYMNPPSHGVSSYELMDFTDIKYKWGLGLHGVFIYSNDSIIMNTFMSSHIFNVYNDEFVFYVKIHGLNSHLDQFNINTEKKDELFIINEDLVKLVTADPKLLQGAHLQIIILKNQQIVNSWYVDENSFEEESKDLPFFNWLKQGTTFEHEYLHITYDRYSKTLIPTDLGMPAVLDMFMPTVHLNNIHLTKESANDVLNLQVDNKYVSWTHARHGLSFYNSFTDVWQGINKYHSYDTVFPMLMDFTFNLPQKIFKISFKKHDDAKKDLWGLRSHVTSAVFVRDNIHKNILQASSPESHNFAIVSLGDKFRHDYPIWYKDDIFTGSTWDVTVYDSEHSVSNGTWGKAMHMISHPYGKNFDDPLEYLWLTYLNWESYVFFLPAPTTHGLLIRAAPKSDVSNIDLTLRWSFEIEPGQFVYSPGIKLSTRWTYAIKNHEKSLKTWDLNAIWDTNPGNYISNLKMYLTRIVPGQKDYKICIEGVKKVALEGVTGHLNVAMSQTSEGKCVKDDTVIDIVMTGEKSPEQLSGDHTYGACQYPMPYVVKPYNTMQCMIAASSVRKYVYNVKTTNIPKEFKKSFLSFMDIIKSHNMAYFDWEDEHNVEIGEHNAKVEVTYPMSDELVDINVYTANYWGSMTGLPMWYWKWFGFEPDSLLLPEMFIDLHSIGVSDHFQITQDKEYWKSKNLNIKDWVLFLGNAESNPTQAVYVKEVADKYLALKLVDAAHVLEVIPGDDGWKIQINNQVVDKNEHSLEWVHWLKVGELEGHPTLMFMLPHSGIFVEYEDNLINLIVPPVDWTWHGNAVV